MDKAPIKLYPLLPYPHRGFQVENRNLRGQECKEGYLHDKEEEDDDDHVDLWVDPHSRPAQAFRVTHMLYPSVVVKQGTDGFTRHQL